MTLGRLVRALLRVRMRVMEGTGGMGVVRRGDVVERRGPTGQDVARTAVGSGSTSGMRYKIFVRGCTTRLCDAVGTKTVKS